MSRKQLCCSQKQKIRKLKKRQRKKKNQYWISTAKTQQKTEILWRYKERRTGKKWTTIYYVVLVREKKKDICFWNFVQLENLYKALSTFHHFFIPYYITWILNCLLEAKRISRHFIHTMYYIHHISYHYFYIPYFA